MASDGGREIAEKRRKERLEAALRANLKQRKAQQRARLAKTQGASAEMNDSEAHETGNARRSRLTNEVD
jgi:hypothetical protein